MSRGSSGMSRRHGDLYYWISNGLPGGMPAFSNLSEIDRWNLVNYLRSIDGRTPAAAPSPSGLLLPLLLPVGWTLLGAGLGLSRWRRRSPRPAASAGQ